MKKEIRELTDLLLESVKQDFFKCVDEKTQDAVTEILENAYFSLGFAKGVEKTYAFFNNEKKVCSTNFLNKTKEIKND